jgi:NitT/TauT family transport system permease protein|eukprot:gene13413-16348_t
MAFHKYTPPAIGRSMWLSMWDLMALLLVIGAIVLIAYGARVTTVPLSTLEAAPLSLDPSNLPVYALRTMLRMLLAIALSLVFTFIYAAAAAKSRRAEMVLVPILDILQSVPILGFLTFTVTFFLNLFPGSVLGAELASVFAIFTSQAWNMTFSMYQSMRNEPKDLEEATQSFHLTGWQRFWRLDVPFAMPGLVWNTMMSMSGGWFFVVASEAITVGDTTVTLPGVGSYVALAIKEQNIMAIFYATMAMLAVILLYDQFLFRPLVAWADKFRFETTSSETVPSSWMLDLFRRARITRLLAAPVAFLSRLVWNLRLPALPTFGSGEAKPATSRVLDRLWLAFIVLAAGYAAYISIIYLKANIAWSDVATAVGNGFITLLRVTVLMILATLVWVPVGVWIGLRPKLAQKVQPLAQFLAAFPANIAFPAFVVLIVHFGLNANIWLSPLMILGTQWYILFNVIAGASAFPSDLKEAANSFHLRGWRWWFKVILPGIFPYYITGAITASGGAWNASIVAEVASWGDTQLTTPGLGSYIANATTAGDFPRVVLGIAVMCIFVTLFNRLFWRPLYAFGERRLRLG